MISLYESKTDVRAFPQISFNKYLVQQSFPDHKLSSHSYNQHQQGNSRFNQFNPTIRSTSEIKKNICETHRSSSLNCIRPTIANFNFNSAQAIVRPFMNASYQKSGNFKIADQIQQQVQDLETVQRIKNRDPMTSFINCENQLKLVSSSQQNAFPLMNSLLCQNKDLVQDTMIQAQSFYQYEIINPEVKKIIEEFKKEQERQDNDIIGPEQKKQESQNLELKQSYLPNEQILKKSLYTSPQIKSSQLVQQEAQIQTPSQRQVQQQNDKVVPICSINKIKVPQSLDPQHSQQQQSPHLNDRQGLYQYMRDCQKVQKFKSEQSIKMSENSLRKSNDHTSPIYSSNLQQNQHDQVQQNHLFIDLTVQKNSNLRYDEQDYFDHFQSAQDPTKSYDRTEQLQIQSQSSSKRTRNSVNSTVKQYGTKKLRSQWGKENQQSEQNAKPQTEKNFYQRLQRDVTRRQSKAKQPIKFDENVNNYKALQEGPLNKTSVLQAIDQLSRRSNHTKQDPRLISKLKTTVNWLFKQVESKKHDTDNEFLSQLEQLDQFKEFLSEI